MESNRRRRFFDRTIFGGLLAILGWGVPTMLNFEAVSRVHPNVRAEADLIAPAPLPAPLPAPAPAVPAASSDTKAKSIGYNEENENDASGTVVPPLAPALPLWHNRNDNSNTFLNLLAPWDPNLARAGADRLRQACPTEIERYCATQIPVRACLEQHYNSSQNSLQQMDRTNKDTPCWDALYPCHGLSDKEISRILRRSGKSDTPDKTPQTRAQACVLAQIYSTAIPPHDLQSMEVILLQLDRICSHHSITYWMAAGSTAGALLHHSMIPWDDDMDIYVLEENLPHLLWAIQNDSTLKALKLNKGEIYKLFDPKKSNPIRDLGWNWPSVDVFPITCNATACIEQAMEARTAPIVMPRNWIFPLKRHAFGRLSMPFPNQLSEMVHHRYSTTKCVRSGIIHSKERFNPRRKHRANCTDLPFLPLFSNRQLETPWPGHPQFTVDRLMDGNETMLSAVLYHDGHEVRRYYADGLMGVRDSAISYTTPYYNTGIHDNININALKLTPPLVPFLPEERLSYLCNRANRSAESLNLEIMPMLDRVQVSNKFGSVAKPKPDNLNVFFWNAERGTAWRDLKSFAEDPDVLILNELDWGMARSGNTHITQLLSDDLKMNYAYGVEFLELTNGNGKEINATLGQINEVGYHGNVVMSKWPIVETKVTRLHELYEHLYKSKGTGLDSGERRLGGRMAMYTRTRMAKDRDILVVAMHGHGGSKTNKLQKDARTICADIKSFSNITAVFVGGDMAGVLANALQNSCNMLPLNETNNFRGKRAVNTWRVECPNGEKPRARFERGDWLVAGGAIASKEDSIKTVHPFRKLPDNKYECISDHSMIEFTAVFGGDSSTLTAREQAN